jgi:hypothetical protein
MGILEGLGGSRYRLPTPESGHHNVRGVAARPQGTLPFLRQNLRPNYRRTGLVCADLVVGCERKPHRRACTGRYFLAEINRDRLDKYGARVPAAPDRLGDLDLFEQIDVVCRPLCYWG